MLHALTAVIAADSLIPFYAESRKTATVGSYDDIIVGRHNLEIPTIAPELADRTLRTAFAEEQGRILLVRVEMRRIDNPGQHLLAVSGFHPASLYFTHFQLVVDLFVLEGELRYGINLLYRSIAIGIVVRIGTEYTDRERFAVQLTDGENFVAHGHGVAFGNHTVTA